MKLRFCQACGLLAPANSLVCPRCGGALEPPAPAQGGEPTPAPRYLDAPDAQPAEADAPAWDDAEEETMGVGRYFLSLLLFGIPVVGLIVMLCWALGATAWPERRRLSQAYLIKRVLWDLLLLAAVVALHGVLLGALYAPMLLGGYGY